MVADKEYMKLALDLAQKAKGMTSPNPMVGCIIVKNNKIIGKGYHKKAGRGHAEIVALRNAGKNADGATMYVTLEPCSHYGKTGPCVNKIIKAGIKEVIIAMKDPNPLVDGISVLKKSKIKVTTGILEDEARKLNEFWIKYITTKKPFVLLKIAMTLDGKIAAKGKGLKYITNTKSRAYVHELRKDMDAVLVGVGTIINDNPELTTRLVKGKNPIKIVVDSTLKIPLNSKVFKGPGKLYVATTVNAPKEKLGKIINKGAKIILTKSKNGKVDLQDLMKKLGKLQITSLMIEGGQKIFNSAIKEKIADKIMIFIAPKVMGNGISLIESLKLAKSDRINLRNIRVKKFEEDIMIEGYAK